MSNHMIRSGRSRRRSATTAREPSWAEIEELQRSTQARVKRLLAAGVLAPEDLLLLRPDRMRGAKVRLPPNRGRIALIFASATSMNRIFLIFPLG